MIVLIYRGHRHIFLSPYVFCFALIVEQNDAGMVDGKTASRQSRISVFYDAFYDTFFRKAPSTREMFDGNMVRQSRALVKVLTKYCIIRYLLNIVLYCNSIY